MYDLNQSQFDLTIEKTIQGCDKALEQFAFQREWCDNMWFTHIISHTG